jgi:hypothetical protein
VGSYWRKRPKQSRRASKPDFIDNTSAELKMEQIVGRLPEIQDE